MSQDRQRFLTRRRLLHAGSLGPLGLTLAPFLELESQAQANRNTRKSPKSCILLFLPGGPSHIDTWDMKPQAPAEVRGDFRPTASSVPGMVMCEHLPRMARMASHYTILRTLHHVNRNHNPACAWMLTGVDPRSDNAAQLAPRADDPPALGSVAARLSPSRSGVPSSVMMPARLVDQGVPVRGQTAGWLGTSYDPFWILQEPNAPGFRVGEFAPQEAMPVGRLTDRRKLLAALDRGASARYAPAQRLTDFQQRALDLMTSDKARAAFELSAEPSRVRDRYGRTTLGQGCLLARRLIEAGVRLVTVFDHSANLVPFRWDTHTQNFPMLKNSLLPQLDQAFSALLEDLLGRGLLQDTVVYVGGEFGRTPRIGQFNGNGFTRPDGRDHYPNCFSGLLAGGLTRSGMIHGASDSRGAFPSQDPVTPDELTATILAAMGLEAGTVLHTRDQRPMPISQGKPVAALLTR
jgi:hypothetical protein